MIDSPRKPSEIVTGQPPADRRVPRPLVRPVGMRAVKSVAAATIVASAAALLVAGAPGQGTDDGIASVNGSTYAAPSRSSSPNPDGRNLPERANDVKKVAQKFKGTHDLAGAAEALVAAAGDQFVYSYGNRNDPQRLDMNGMHSMDDYYAQRVMICYEFVHYVAYLASNQRTTASGAPLAGASAPAVYDTRHYTVWDGKSDIPRGKVVVFVAYVFNNDGGFYHVGISLGHGKIAHNSSAGSVQISDIKDVNSIGYKEVRISDYNYHDTPQPGPPGTSATTAAPATSTPKPTPAPTPAPTSAPKSVGMVPGLRDALDERSQGFHFAGPTTCCGDPLGAMYGMPTAIRSRRSRPSSPARRSTRPSTTPRPRGRLRCCPARGSSSAI